MSVFVLKARDSVQSRWTRRRIIVCALIFVALLLAGLAVGLGLGLSKQDHSNDSGFVSSIYYYQSAKNIDATVKNLTMFNTLPNSRKIKQVFMYGTFASYTARDGYAIPTDALDYYPRILAIPGVEQIHAIMEGDRSLLGGDPREFAMTIAKTFCPLNVGGVTVDLEPIDTYLNFALPLFGNLSSFFTSPQFGCVSSTFPKGRYMSIFAGPKYALQLTQAMGANGFFIMSGYDLIYNDALLTHSPTDYAKVLKSQIEIVATSLYNTTAKFSVAIPGAASSKEYTSFFDINSGVTTQNTFKNFDYGKGYVEASINVINSFLPVYEQNFYGATIWTITDNTTIKDITYSPANPFDLDGSANWLSQNLP